MNEQQIEPGSSRADERFHIKIAPQGPYLVFGKPPLNQQFIVPNEQRISWDFREGESYPMDDEPVALCRCGASARKPYCDGSHVHADWDGTLTASGRPLLEGAEEFPGPELTLTDNETYCVFARFCDAAGRVWNLVGHSDDPTARELTVREANLCPGGRLSAWNNRTGEPYEPHYETSLGLIEDTLIHASGGLWVRGGIPVTRDDGFTYEIRNRVVLCRCGQASNKPFCDGTHASFHFDDGLKKEP